MNFEPMKEFMDYLTGWRIPGNSIVIYKNGKSVFEYSSGYSDIQKREKMTPDKFLYIYSCSKIATTLAALQLWEKGLYKLDDPLYDFIPEYKNMYVRVNGSNEVIKSPKPITIHNLFTMCAGLNYRSDTPWHEKARSITNGKFDTVATVKCLAEEPLDFVPGEKWQYSLCHDVLAALVEVVSGKKFSSYMEDNIFKPLGIDATYSDREPYRSKMCRQYYFDDGMRENDISKMQRCVVETGGGKITDEELKNSLVFGENYESGGAGIITNVYDYAKLMGAIANGGINHKGEKIIDRKTLEMWRTNQLDEKQLEGLLTWPQLKGYGYGLGVRTMLDKTIGTPIGEIGWGGAAGANALADIDNNISFFYAHHMLRNQEVYVQPRLRNVLYKCMSL